MNSLLFRKVQDGSEGDRAWFVHRTVPQGDYPRHRYPSIMATNEADPSAPTGWTSSDAWVLAAILIQGEGTGQGGSLSDLVGAADYLNHAILLESEVEHAIRVVRTRGP